MRFKSSSTKKAVLRNVPHQYVSMHDGFDPRNGPKNYQTNKVAIGYGKKWDFTDMKEAIAVPGPQYDNHSINSISYISHKENAKTLTGFYNKYDKW